MTIIGIGVGGANGKAQQLRDLLAFQREDLSGRHYSNCQFLSPENLADACKRSIALATSHPKRSSATLKWY